MLGEIPSVGDRLALRVDPANPQHFDYDEASTETAQAASAAASDFGEDVSDRLSDEHLSHEHLSDELARLADLRDRGALTDSEFAAAKKKLSADSESRLLLMLKSRVAYVRWFTV